MKPTIHNARFRRVSEAEAVNTGTEGLAELSRIRPVPNRRTVSAAHSFGPSSPSRRLPAEPDARPEVQDERIDWRTNPPTAPITAPDPIQIPSHSQ